MKKQFVTYDIAKNLKEIGFNEKCFAYFNENKELLLITPSEDRKFIPGFYDNTNAPKWLCSIFSSKSKKANICTAPLWQQVFDWLFENKGMEIEVFKSVIHFYVDEVLQSSKYQFVIDKTGHTDYLYVSADYNIWYDNYYDAREQAILKALELCNKNMK